MQTFTQRKVEKQGKCRMYRNVYRNVSDKKKRSYTCITRKKWSYTCITRKNGVIHVQPEKMELYMYNSKKMELHIPIHSYTSHLFRRFWGRGF